MAPVRVLLVDDHELFRVGLRELLEEEGFEVDDAASGEAGVRRCRAFRPDVVVMDMNMPGMSGIEATRWVLEAQPEAAVLMLTVAADDARVLEAIRAGATGYLLKEARLSEIVAGVTAAAAGRSPIAPGIAGALVASVREAGERPAAHPEAATLTDRERAVLSLISEGRSNRAIARQLHLSARAVERHVQAIFSKLGLPDEDASDRRVAAVLAYLRATAVR
jgi:DNA-binding NarL/FixJ family response regulator